MLSYESKEYITKYYNEITDTLNNSNFDDELLIFNDLCRISGAIDSIKTHLLSMLYYNVYGKDEMRKRLEEIKHNKVS